MNTCYYYAFDDSLPALALNACSLSSEEYPLTVNCAGNLSTSFPFTTDNPGGREDYYMILMTSGTMRLTLPDGEHNVGTGDVILFPPHYHYRYVYRGEAPLSYLWVHFTGSYAERFLRECQLSPLPALFRTEQSSSLSAAFLQMFDIFNARGQLQHQELACVLEQLLLRLASTVDRDTQKHPLERSLRHIHAFYHKPIRIPELAKMEGLCNSRYITVFQKAMGMPPSEYLIKLRIRTACDLLRGTDMAIKQIGTMVGYQDAQFFSRIFKREIGVSPQVYRNRA
ncbi:MAG: AraC family transcriptional regulator [Clostridia bacterium]|nr:AraC family transcriptional regulator [Clostridia bacterium]